MHRPGRPALLAMLPAILLAACTGDGEPADPTAAPTTEPASPTDEPTSAASETPTSPQQSPVEPVEVEVDFEQRAPDGTVVRVSRFEVTETNVLVEVEIIVAAERAFIQLNNPQQNPALLVDDQGTEYELVPPEDNFDLMLDGGQQLEGTLAFQGPLERGATTVQLVFNRNSNAEPETQGDQLQPHFEFEPVDITGEGDG